MSFEQDLIFQTLALGYYDPDRILTGYLVVEQSITVTVPAVGIAQRADSVMSLAQRDEQKAEPVVPLVACLDGTQNRLQQSVDALVAQPPRFENQLERGVGAPIVLPLGDPLVDGDTPKVAVLPTEDSFVVGDTPDVAEPVGQHDLAGAASHPAAAPPEPERSRFAVGVPHVPQEQT